MLRSKILEGAPECYKNNSQEDPSVFMQWILGKLPSIFGDVWKMEFNQTTICGTCDHTEHKSSKQVMNHGHMLHVRDMSAYSTLSGFVDGVNAKLHEESLQTGVRCSQCCKRGECA